MIRWFGEKTNGCGGGRVSVTSGGGNSINKRCSVFGFEVGVIGTKRYTKLYQSMMSLVRNDGEDIKVALFWTRTTVTLIFRNDISTIGVG